MRVVVALGGNALLRRGQPMTVDNQSVNVGVACDHLAPIAGRHDLVVSHGNGPQIGLLALEEAEYTATPDAPLDGLGAETQGMIGYLVERELVNRLPAGKPVVSVLTMIEVDPADPAFEEPTKPIGPCYSRGEAETLAAEQGWVFGMEAVIGARSDIEDMLAGTAGTQVTVDVSGTILAPYPPEATR